MLLELNLRNFILIEDISLSFEEGLSVFTGETGAGKTIILEGLRICLGSRTSTDYLRDPEKKAVFEMVMDIDGELLAVSREIFPSGRALSRFNGDIVNVDILQERLSPYLDIYGQKDHFRLLEPSWQRAMIHGFAPDQIQPILNKLSSQRVRSQALAKKAEVLKERIGQDLEGERQTYKELKELRIDPEKDHELEQEFFRLQHQVEIRSLQEQARQLLDENILPSLHQLQTLTEDLKPFENWALSSVERLESLRIELEDLRGDYSAESLEVEPQALREMEERLQKLHEVEKKHHRSLEELLLYQHELEEMLVSALEAESDMKHLAFEMQDNLASWEQASQELVEEEMKVFEELREDLKELLERMEMRGVRMELSFKPIQEDFHSMGRMRMEILMSTGRRDPLPLKEVLSGGETSRLILALKSILGKREDTRTMIFDEIDTGISGKVAYQVGELIRELSRGKQVIAITHLPQLASFADHHYYISKHAQTTQVQALSEEEQSRRLAVMMTSETSEAALQSARELRSRARKETK